jgi:hypothetical protein
LDALILAFSLREKGFTASPRDTYIDVAPLSPRERVGEGVKPIKFLNITYTYCIKTLLFV